MKARLADENLFRLMPLSNEYFVLYVDANVLQKLDSIDKNSAQFSSNIFLTKIGIQ